MPQRYLHSRFLIQGVHGVLEGEFIKVLGVFYTMSACLGPVGAQNSVVGADQGFRAPSWDQESVRDVCVAEMVVLSAGPADATG